MSSLFKRSSSLLMLPLCLSLGAACTPSQTVTDQQQAASNPPKAQADTKKSTPALAAVYEWGVTFYDAQGGELVTKPPSALVVPEPEPDRPRPTRKPVIYFDGDAGLEVTATATFAGGGKVHEVWPTPANGAQPAHGESYTWSKVKLTQEDCAAGWAPTTTSPACASLPDPAQCEAADFAKWVARPAKCLDVDGVPAPALLYNGMPSSLVAPVQIGDDATFKNVSDQPLAPFMLVHMGKAHVTTAPLAPGAEISLMSDSGALIKAVEPVQWTQAQLKEAGLPEPIIQDFMRAWTPHLTDLSKWRTFGFLSAPAIDKIATLKVMPEPKKTVRVMAFTLENAR